MDKKERKLMDKKERKPMDKKEAAFTCKLEKWMIYNLNHIDTYGWEVKYPRSVIYKWKQDKSFAKELRNLLIWQRAKVIYKFSDIARMGTIHDGFTAHGWSCFFFTWDGKHWYAIDAKTIKSLTESYEGIDEKTALIICDYKGEVK